MIRWLTRWFDKPKRDRKTVLRSTPVANAPTPAYASGITGWKPGDVILGEYRVMRELGHGSMGSVYLVADTQSPDQQFAVKRVRVAGDVYRRNFLAELQTWIDLHEHPHLVSCRFFRTVGEDLVIFAQYVEGAALSRWIEEKQLTRIETLLDIAIQFAWGLHAAHEQGVIHQDAKPSNVLIATDGTVKVADFGLARAQAVATRVTVDNSRDSFVVAHAGGKTDEYCSPEQAQDQALSRRSDLWSWGVSVLEMFTGRVTWRSGVLAATALEEFLEVQARATAPANDRLLMPASVAAVLRRCFRDDPGERWPTLLAAAEELVDAYAVVCATAYPRSMPAMPARERGSIAGLDHMIAGGKWADPKVWLIAALKAAGRDPAEADKLAHARDAHSRKAQAVGDLGTYQEAQTIFEHLIETGRSELRERSAALCMDQALVHRFVDDPPGAIRAYDRAIAIYECLVDQEGRRELAHDLATGYMNKATAVRLLGDHRAAVAFYDRAIAICERLVDQEGRRELAHYLARAYMTKAIAVSDQGDHRAAVALYDRAIAIYERLVDQESRRELANDLAMAYSNKATAVNDLGDHRAAMVLYERAIAIYECLVDQEGRRELANDLARAYMNKAIVVSNLGDQQAAVALYDRALAIYERLVDQEGRRELANDLARIYSNRAIAVNNLGDHRAAVAFYDRAIAIRERLVDQEGRRELANDLARTYSNKATAVNNLGDHRAAVALIDRAIAIYERLVDQESRRELSHDLASAYLNKAITVSNLGDHRDTVALSDRTIAIYKRLIDQEGRRELVGRLAWAQALQANALKQIGERTRASALARSAVATLDNEVKRTGRADLQHTLAWARQNLADLL